MLAFVRQTPPDLILLDLMLPGTDGLTLCREIRRFCEIPIVMVTAKIEEIDRLLGLEIGADDYICKPYSPREVVARVKTILRRCKRQRDPIAADEISPLIIDESRFQASWHDKLLDLTPAEFRLLKTLSHEPGKVFSREQLLNQLYDDYRVVTDRTIDSHIKNLRRKLEALDEEQSLSVPCMAWVTAGKPMPAGLINLIYTDVSDNEDTQLCVIAAGIGHGPCRNHRTTNGRRLRKNPFLRKPGRTILQSQRLP